MREDFTSPLNPRARKRAKKNGNSATLANNVLIKDRSFAAR
jgi:hypothetical protein